MKRSNRYPDILDPKKRNSLLQMDYIKRKRDAGICAGCKAMSPTFLCSECKVKARSYHKLWRDRKKAVQNGA